VEAEMTTIAFDGRYLAADSLICTNDTKEGYVKKIIATNIKEQFDAIVAFAGEYAAALAFIDSLRENYPNAYAKPNYGEPDYCALVVHSCGGFDEYTSKYEYPETFKSLTNFRAMGSGVNFALGAMAAGKNAKEAVEIAIQFDAKSGGDVLVFDTKEWRFI
jgi:ATP-dependent protease HslVU (ClpYQ) peptidase subunit